VTIDDSTLDITQSIDIRADIGDVFHSLLHRLGEGFTKPQGESLQMTMEQWPGGPLVPRSRQRYRPSLGPRAGYQAARAL
jgi:hypothetical protein